MHPEPSNPPKRPNTIQTNTTQTNTMQTKTWNHASTINGTNSPEKSTTIESSAHPSATPKMFVYETPMVSAPQFPADNSARPQRNRHPPKKYELAEENEVIL
jgi:hypothetical protein